MRNPINPAHWERITRRSDSNEGAQRWLRSFVVQIITNWFCTTDHSCDEPFRCWVLVQMLEFCLSMFFFRPYSIKEVLLYFWPRFLFKATRCQFKESLRRISVQQRQYEMQSGLLSSKARIDPWAFIRVKDERATLLASLNSILPVSYTREWLRTTIARMEVMK